MARITKGPWWCVHGHRNKPQDRECISCGLPHYERHAAVHASERAVVYYNPATGEHRTPPRSDMPMPPVYQQQGFERREIDSVLAWEREAGVVHEASEYHPGNEETDPPVVLPDPAKTKAAKEIAVNDMRDAIASGPWTGLDNLL